MNIDQFIVDRFQSLITQGDQVRSLLSQQRSVSFVDDEGASQWGISCLSLLGRVFGKESDHYIQLNALFPHINRVTDFRKAKGIIKAAKDDYEHGYLFNTRTLIQAEVFDDFLEQAAYLLASNYYGPAAVIAGSVLEDGLRKLCLREQIMLPAKPKLDTMNAELAKAGVYNVLTQKKITALADVRNKAAHGLWTEFSAQDVEQVLSQTRIFMEQYFS